MVEDDIFIGFAREQSFLQSIACYKKDCYKTDWWKYWLCAIRFFVTYCSSEWHWEILTTSYCHSERQRRILLPISSVILSAAKNLFTPLCFLDSSSLHSSEWHWEIFTTSYCHSERQRRIFLFIPIVVLKEVKNLLTPLCFLRFFVAYRSSEWHWEILTTSYCHSERQRRILITYFFL